MKAVRYEAWVTLTTVDTTLKRFDNNDTSRADIVQRTNGAKI